MQQTIAKGLKGDRAEVLTALVSVTFAASGYRRHLARNDGPDRRDGRLTADADLGRPRVPPRLHRVGDRSGGQRRPLALAGRSLTLAVFCILGLATVAPASGHPPPDGSTAATTGSTEEGAVFVNGVRLDETELQGLERRYSSSLPAGRYWYDPVSGLWGSEGGPATGQIHSGLQLGGPLSANASGTATRVFINGREIHPLELMYLQQLFGYVVPGRYWLNPLGVGGFEGGGPAFDLNAAAAPATGGGSGYIDRGPFGTMGGDGNCFYFNSPDGSSYMPDGC